eukprot:jgi/Hompol1/2589/HPOL_002962-RA
MKGHKGDIYCLTLIDDGSRFASGSSDSHIKIWDIGSGACVATLKGHSQAVTCLKMCDEFLYSGSLDRTIMKWDLVDNRCDQVIEGHTEWIKALDANSQYLISGGWDETVHVWSKATSALLYKIVLGMGPILSIQCDESRI